MNVIGVDRRELHPDKNDERADVDRQSSNLRELAHRRPEHWSDSVAEDEYRQADEASRLRDVKVLSHAVGIGARYAGRVDRGADVYGKRQEGHLEGDEGFVARGPVVPGIKSVI